MRYTIILARKNDNSSVFRYVCGEERLDSRLRWWFFGFGRGAATIWLRKGNRYKIDDGGCMVTERGRVRTLAIDA